MQEFAGYAVRRRWSMFATRSCHRVGDAPSPVADRAQPPWLNAVVDEAVDVGEHTYLDAAVRCQTRRGKRRHGVRRLSRIYCHWRISPSWPRFLFAKRDRHRLGVRNRGPGLSGMLSRARTLCVFFRRDAVGSACRVDIRVVDNAMRWSSLRKR